MSKQVPASSLISIVKEAAKQLNGAPFTVRSKKTGKDYTFKIKQSEYNGKHYVHAYVETEYMNFIHLGFYDGRGGLIKKGSKVASPSATAISWILDKVYAKATEVLEANLEVFHLGNCMVCGKKLTDANSIERGIGPKCLAGA